MSYAKLFSSITESSLWSASKESRLLFVSMLARANAVGFVEASIPGLARISNLSREETETALAELMAPDPDDKSGNNEGRRVIKMDGGWGIVNYEVYRNRRDEEERREYMREYMARYRKKHVNSCKQSKPQLAKAEAEAEAEAKKKEDTSSPAAPEFDDGLFEDFWDAYGKKKDRKATEGAWRKLSQDKREQAFDGVAAYVAAHPDPKYRKDPVRYLKGECWNDELPAAPITNPHAHGSEAWWNWNAEHAR